MIFLVLILLHGPDGREIRVNTEQVTSLRSGQGGDQNKAFTGAVHCMVSLADGKFVTVAEPCDEVQKMMEQPR